MNSTNLSNWVTLGRLVKTQADNFSTIIGPWELGTLFFNFVTSILFAFMVVNSSEYAKVVLGSAGFFCVGNLVRLHLKTISEQTIRKVVSFKLIEIINKGHFKYSKNELNFE